MNGPDNTCPLSLKLTSPTIKKKELIDGMHAQQRMVREVGLGKGTDCPTDAVDKRLHLSNVPSQGTTAECS